MKMFPYGLMLIFISSALSAQVKRDLISGDLVKEKKNKSFQFPSMKNKLFYGGNAGLQFGAFTFIDLSPLIGYRITEKLHAGIGGSYIYTSNRFISKSATIFGGRIFARYFMMPYLFFHAEKEWLMSRSFFFGNCTLSTPLMGFGYRQAIGSRGFMDLMGLWNFSARSVSYYTNPVIRIGFCIQ